MNYQYGYSFEEMTDMHLCYGQANFVSREAVRRYREMFPARRTPNRQTFDNIDRLLRETGKLKPTKFNSGRQRYARTIEVEERILRSIENNNTLSTRQIANNFNISQSSVWRTLHDQQLHPYHIQRVQHLLPQDHPPRLEFSRWLLGKLAEDPQFSSNILFTDEASFTRQGIVNFHNQHLWSDINPHAIRATNFQHKFSINVHAGIIGNQLIGPFMLQNRLDGQSYLNFLTNDLDVLLDDVPLDTRINMWFQHDGTPAHFSRHVREYLNLRYPRRWIGRGGFIHWPARSPDLNPLDFHTWGHVKELVYGTPVNTREELWQRIEDAFQTIRNTPGIFQRIRRSLTRRAEACVDSRGGHFQHLL